MDDSADLITLSCPDHHNRLVKGLWDMFISKDGVDFDLGWGVEAHRCILDVFLSPEKLTMRGADQLVSLGSLEYVLEFLYTGRVTVHRDHLPVMLGTSKEAGFQLLVDAIKNVSADVNFKGDCGGKKVNVKSTHMTRDIQITGRDHQLTGQLQETLDATGLADSDTDNDNDKLARGGMASSIFEDVEPREFLEVEAQELPAILHIKKRPPNLADEDDVMVGGLSGNGLGLPLPHTEMGLAENVSFKKEPLEETPSDGEEVSEFVLSELADSPSSSQSSLRKYERPCACNTCGIPCETKADLVSHMLICSEHYTNKCSACGKCFSNADHMRTHMKLRVCKKPVRCETKTDDKPFRCDICGKSFLYLNSLKLHASTHPDDKPFRCETCGKSFTQKSSLVTHSYIHTGDKSLFCGDCSKYFSSQEKLETHKRTVTCKKKLYVKRCQKTYQPPWNPYCCKACGKNFVSKIFLIRHVCDQTSKKC